MTTISIARETVRNQAPGAASGLFNVVKGYLARSRAERQLHQLDDRMLADIGLNRSEIGRSVWGD